MRFLFRYQVVYPGVTDEELAKIPSMSKYRFQRMAIFINSNFVFSMTPLVHMSVRESDQYLINLQTLQKLKATWYERPMITSIEAVRGAAFWKLTKKDQMGNFFIVKPREEALNDSDEEIPEAQLGYGR